MRAIIIGAGKIGFNIAKLLVQEKNDVVVIEKDEDRVQNLQENLDVQVIIANGASAGSLQEAGIAETDLLVAVTGVDEINIIACMLAKNFGVGKTIARVRNPEYIEDNRSEGKSIFNGIDLMINPELVIAKEIANLIDVPEALDVVYYAQGMVQMLELKIPPQAPVANKCLKEINYQSPFVIVAIFRDGQMLVPRGDDRILPNDIIFLLGKTKEMVRIEKLLGTERKKAERVMILGGDFAGYHLARILEQRKYSVKIIEREYKRCVDVCNSLKNTMILHGDATDIDFLKSEGVSDVDAFVCLTDDDKMNLLVSLIVKHLGAKKIITQVRRSDYISLMEDVGIDVGISPRTLIANAILRFINRNTNVLSVTLLSQESAELIELVVTKDSKIANKKLKNLNFPKGAIVGTIYRKKQVIIPSGEDSFMPGDTVVVFALPQKIASVMDFFKV